MYVTLEEAKDHLHIIDDEEDIYIGGLIEVCEDAVLNEVRASTAGVGTVSTSTTALTGSGTKFLDYKAGDVIRVDGETNRTIATVTSDTALTVTVAFTNTASSLTFRVETTPLVSGVLPKPLKQAVLLMIGQLFAVREPVNIGNIVTKLPYTLDFLIAPYKSWTCR
jgi:hypothetical protein